MESNWNIYLIIFGMAVSTYFTRQAPFLVLRGSKLNGAAAKWLSFVPVSVIAALLCPEIFMSGGQEGRYFNLTSDNLYLYSAVVTFAVGWIFKNFFLTIACGMGFTALLRYFLV